MSSFYNELSQSILEAIEDIGENQLARRTVIIVPVKEYQPKEIKEIRKTTGLSQRLFASYLGVSTKTVEAWEAGTNRPSGASSRLLHMMEMNHHLTTEYPFVQVK